MRGDKLSLAWLCFGTSRMTAGTDRAKRVNDNLATLPLLLNFRCQFLKEAGLVLRQGYVPEKRYAK